ncbi:MAG: hypothetical protein WCB14_02085 [Candidatus Acidiferrales bacterium]
MPREQRTDEPKSKSTTLSWYVLVGLLVAATFIVCVFVVVKFVPERFWPTKQWLTFTFFSVVLFVLLAKMYWTVRKPRSFWWLLLLLMISHIAVYMPLLRFITRAFMYVVIMPFEAMLIVLVVKLVANVMPDTKARL